MPDRCRAAGPPGAGATERRGAACRRILGDSGQPGPGGLPGAYDQGRVFALQCDAGVRNRLAEREVQRVEA